MLKKTPWAVLRMNPWPIRLIGIVLFAVLLIRVDIGELGSAISSANPLWVLLSFGLILPLIWLKTLRWQGILHAQSVKVRIWPAYWAYLGGLFAGVVTPGRIGEFTRAFQVAQAYGIPKSRAFASVLADRLFDLYVLIVVGTIAMLAVAAEFGVVLIIVVTLFIALFPVAILVDNRIFRVLNRTSKVGNVRISAVLSRWVSWASEVREDLRKLTGPKFAVALLITLASYALFFTQAYLLALAVDLPIGFGYVVLVMALSSLVALIPVSISGLGTRDLVVVAYLATLGITSELALGFSLLVFLTFYVGSGLIGAAAWFLKPLPMERSCPKGDKK